MFDFLVSILGSYAVSVLENVSSKPKDLPPIDKVQPEKRQVSKSRMKKIKYPSRLFLR